MTSPFSDELISAYLDGELSDQERAVVEQQLRENAQLQRMCDELRALQGALRAMPTTDPPGDLAERVLRQAERRMLLGNEADAEAESKSASPEEPLPTNLKSLSAAPKPAHAPPMWRKWQFLVAFTASAAALLLAVLLVAPGSPYRNLAQRAEPDSSETTATSETRPAAESESAVVAERDLDAEGDADADTAGRIEESNQPANRDGATSSAVEKQESVVQPLRQELGEAGRSSVTETPQNPGKQSSSPARQSQRVAGEDSLRDDASTGRMRERTDSDRPLERAPGAASGETLGKSARAGSSQAVAPQSKEMADEAKAMRGGRANQQRLVQQLLRQLDSDESLLVQVSLPPSVKIDSLRVSAGQNSSTELRAVEEVLLENGIASRTQLERAGAREKARKLSVGREPSADVFVVEGQPADVRRSLVQLVERDGVQLETLSSESPGTTVDVGDYQRGTAFKKAPQKGRTRGYGIGYGDQRGGYPGMGGYGGAIGGDDPSSGYPSGKYGGASNKGDPHDQPNSKDNQESTSNATTSDKKSDAHHTAGDPAKLLPKKQENGGAGDSTAQRETGGKDVAERPARSVPPPAASGSATSEDFMGRSAMGRPKGTPAAPMVRIVLSESDAEDAAPAIRRMAEGEAEQRSESRIVHLLFRYRPAAPAETVEAAKED